jgi:hypothetical protein
MRSFSTLWPPLESAGLTGSKPTAIVTYETWLDDRVLRARLEMEGIRTMLSETERQAAAESLLEAGRTRIVVRKLSQI